MGVPAKLTERQIKFAELLVYNEGRLSPAEAAFQAGYKTRPRQAAVNAEVARGKAGGLYVDQKLVMTGNVDNMSPNEIKDRLKKILDENKEIINITPEDIKLEELELPTKSAPESD